MQLYYEIIKAINKEAAALTAVNTKYTANF